MTPIAIVMMLLFMVAIWGGLIASYIRLTRADRAGTVSLSSTASAPQDDRRGDVDRSAP